MRAPELPDVFTRAQAVALGVGDVRLAGLVRRGEIERLRHGVYAVIRTDPPLPEERSARHVTCAKAVLSHHTSGFVASHLTAAAVHALPLPLGRMGFVHVTAVQATQRSRGAPGVRVHHSDSAIADVSVVGGVAVTTVARTVADCLRCWAPRVSVPIADAALRRGLVTPDDIEDELDRQWRWKGRPRALRSLDLVDGRRESWLESYAYVLFGEWGIRLPEPQVWVDDEAGHALGRVDGAWLDDATVLELDGKTKYDEPDGDDLPLAWLAEKARYDQMGNLGLERVRFTLRELRGQPEPIRRTIRLRRSVRSRGRFSGSFRETDPTGLRFSSVLRPTG